MSQYHSDDIAETKEVPRHSINFIIDNKTGDGPYWNTVIRNRIEENKENEPRSVKFLVLPLWIIELFPFRSTISGDSISE